MDGLLPIVTQSDPYQALGLKLEQHPIRLILARYCLTKQVIIIIQTSTKMDAYHAVYQALIMQKCQVRYSDSES